MQWSLFLVIHIYQEVAAVMGSEKYLGLDQYCS